MPRRLRRTWVDYLLTAMGVVLLGSLAFGAWSDVPLGFAAGGGSLVAGTFMAVGLINHPAREDTESN